MLGKLGADTDVPGDIDLLGIEAGRHDIQRLFYWYVCKAYHRPEFTSEENNHVNYGWLHRQTPIVTLKTNSVRGAQMQVSQSSERSSNRPESRSSPSDRTESPG